MVLANNLNCLFKIIFTNYPTTSSKNSTAIQVLREIHTYQTIFLDLVIVKNEKIYTIGFYFNGQD